MNIIIIIYTCTFILNIHFNPNPGSNDLRLTSDLDLESFSFPPFHIRSPGGHNAASRQGVEFCCRPQRPSST